MTDNILLVDDDSLTIQLLSHMLGDVGNLNFATSGEDALRIARESTPDLILLDAEMPGMDGFEVCKSLKADPALADIPVIFVTSHRDTPFEVSGFGLGAADFITKPVNASLVVARVRTQLRLKHLADELRRIAAIDALTSIANRRSFDTALEREWCHAQQVGKPLALLMIDVDHFKLFNDLYGHPTGDACLRAVAQAVAGAGLRSTDLAARYGGEEFAVLLPATPLGGAERVAHGILDTIEALDIHHGASAAGHITVSVGIACCEQVGAGDATCEDVWAGRLSAQLVQAADGALYSAKQAGRAQAMLINLVHGEAPRPASPSRRLGERPGSRATGVLFPPPAAALSDRRQNFHESPHAQNP
jgi:diguanylate cyclase (GGDEF)-like protein